MFEGRFNGKRKARREKLYYSFTVFNSRDEIIGKVIDISPGGLKIVSKFPVELHSTDTLKIKLPEGISDLEEITFDAECVWSSKAGDHYQIGYKTEYPNDTTRRIVRTIIDLLASPGDLIL